VALILQALLWCSIPRFAILTGEVVQTIT
jgi:hypothetical protein